MPKKVRRRLPVQLPPTRIEEQYAAALIRAVISVMKWAYGPVLDEAPKLAEQRKEARLHGDSFDPSEPRDEKGKWTAEGDYAKGVVESTGSVPPKVRNEPAPLEKSEYWAAMDAVGGQFTDDERVALSSWTSSNYKNINRAAREHPDTEPYIPKIDSAIAKSEAPRDMLVYRGFDESRMFGFKPGDVFSDNGFIATSARWDVARSFASSSGGEHGNAGAVVKIIVPKGAPALPVVGQAGDEGEVLLPRGSHFKVLQVVHSGSGDEDQLNITAQLLEPGHHDSVDPEHVPTISSGDEQRFVWRPEDLILEHRATRFDSFESRRVAQLIREAARRMRLRLNKKDIAKLAKKFAPQTNTHQRIQLGHQLHEAMAIDVPLVSAFAEQRIADFVRENVALISRIPQHFHGQIETMVQHAVVHGRLARDLADDIQDAFGVADRHARMIARDQIGKLTADLNHERQRSLGVSRFVWRTMQDERVRGTPGGRYPDALPSHFALNGKTFSYDNPPTPPGADGPLLPGEDYNCRCYAEPVLDDLIDDADAGDPSILEDLGEDLDEG